MTSDHFATWKSREALAEAMIPMIGQLYRERDVTILVHSRSLVNKSVISILKTHRYVRQVEGRELGIEDTMPILAAVAELDLGPARVDIGKLAVAYASNDEGLSVADYVARALAGATGEAKIVQEGPRDVVLYGFGRIGRLVARLLVEKSGSGNGLRLRAVVVRKAGDDDLKKRASLLRRDSVHGAFNGSIHIDTETNSICANGNTIKVIYANDPSEVDYTDHGISNAVLIDNTGKWRDREGLSKHKRPGISKVVLTAPGKGDVKNIVHGVNHDTLSADDDILSCASCTTNAIVPALKAINDEYGVEHGHVETVHAFTNDQNLLDNYHKGNRRGRSAPLNMVLTETGAASAVAKALPELGGLITGSAIRVPTPDVSMAILNLTLKQETSRDELVEYLRETSLHSAMKRQIDFVASPDLVSTDLVGSRAACIIDANATIVDGKHAVVYAWYDNEFGYSCQVVRVVQHITGVEYPLFPQD
ncbi:glyceraldehyde-3-phosphate dehydrogenase [Nocardioides sp. AE5]|uniref:glyceraldehyde-3-phosphate dehydrogenase n=1 Tax=Nocardioides sp. AE5 TaxID=2962573 RepID=UPI0028816AB8|nr:glyceraldehyde-3-phosphate dehydrogenase [Nocardioides sp. AE5]MDT0201460.1 glyceraldehyde-3-phosphate dehydrogenase [Nocardioides sp. AE5]